MAGLSNCRLCKETNNSVRFCCNNPLHYNGSPAAYTGWDRMAEQMSRHDARQVYGASGNALHASMCLCYLSSTYIYTYVHTLDIQ